MVHKLKDVLKQAVTDDNNIRITILEFKQIVKIQQNLREAVHCFSTMVEMPMFLLILENALHFILGPGKLVVFVRWSQLHPEPDVVMQVLELICYYLWVEVAIQPFHQISTLDDEMNHLLNDFLLLHLEDGRDREAFVELERAVQQRCAFPLSFNFLGIMNVNRGIIAEARKQFGFTWRRSTIDAHVECVQQFFGVCEDSRDV
ncbi:hypothetical protein EVAR_31242_1 [Eumeta japonica]|uniref:Uncharacterized protein n=1 Tax=Eumeta variegata TaxID=151549 RepID=A0A4C1W2J2_EUMVA|nr:hypothetical protein EVAR_31242_1 [Eumeta japonica]